MNNLDGQIAIITGASRGIGQACALALADAGATVIGTATSEAGAEKISAELGGRGIGMPLDVCDAGAADAFIKSVTAAHGAPTILVNNAGITRDNLLMRLSEDDWNAVINTNLTGNFKLCKAVIRGMLKARQGRIINIASVVGLTGNAGQANYAASKAGLIAFSKSLAQEVGSRGITVNVVAPGFIETDMTAELDEDQRNRLTESIALQRLGLPADIAAAVAFLASPAASFISGETLHVNGGMYMA